MIIWSGLVWSTGQHLEWDEAVLTSVATNRLTDHRIIVPLQILFVGPIGLFEIWKSAIYFSTFRQTNSKEILNLKGHLNRIIGSKFTAILLNGWILPIGGASAVKGLPLQPALQACLIYNIFMSLLYVIPYFVICVKLQTTNIPGINLLNI